jgi:hypothetical protein
MPMTLRLCSSADLEGDVETARQFTPRDIAERFRNTYSHVPFGSKGKAAIFIRLLGMGEVPAALGDFGIRPERWLVPAMQDDFNHICRVFDSCDVWMSNGPLAAGHHWVQAGLDFDFSPEFRAAASQAIEQAGSRGSSNARAHAMKR